MTQLDDLLTQHQEEIALLESLVKDVLLPECDKVWLLRYILSNKTAKDAEAPVRFSIAYLQEHAKEIARIRSGGKLPHEDVIKQFQVAGEHKFTKSGEPLFYVRIGLCNTKGMMDALPFDDVLLFFTIYRFKTLEYLDKETRKQGRLLKAITVLDFQGFSVARGNDSRFAKIIGESSKLSEKLFPQLLGATVFINVPRFLYWSINLIKPLMSKRAVEKMAFCPGNVVSTKSITECPYLTKNLALEDVPSFLGGKCNCPGGCIAGVPNSQPAPINEIDANGLASITVPARSILPIEFPVIKGMKMQFAIRVDDRKVELSATFTEQATSLSTLTMEKRFINSEDGTINGSWEAPSDGTWSIQFDNTHSMLRTKKVFYKIEQSLVQSSA